MKRFLWIALLLCTASTFAADRKSADKSTVSDIIESRNASNIHPANIMAGDIEINAFLALYSTYTQGTHYTTFDLVFGSEYFVRDHLSLGGELSHLTTRGYTETRVGPAGKYYFFEQDRFSPFVGEAVLYNHTSVGADYWTNKTTFGFKYFILPSLAAVSSLNWYHLFGRSAPDAYASLNQVSIEMGLAIHL